MTQVFILQNQEQYFYSKQGEWTDGRDAKILFRTEHKDEAVNQCVEITAKDYTQRVHVIECDLNEKGNPQLAAEQLPPPRPADNEEPLEETDDTQLVADTAPDQALDDQPDVAPADKVEEANTYTSIQP